MFSAKLHENLSEVLSGNHGKVIIGFLHTSVFICLKNTEKVNKPNNKTKDKNMTGILTPNNENLSISSSSNENIMPKISH